MATEGKLLQVHAGIKSYDIFYLLYYFRTLIRGGAERSTPLIWVTGCLGKRGFSVVFDYTGEVSSLIEEISVVIAEEILRRTQSQNAGIDYERLERIFSE